MSKAEFNHPAFEYGTDAQFLHWTSFQESCLDGAFNQIQDDGRGRNIACHVRRLTFGSGMGHKPVFSAVPMTDRQHQVQGGKDGEVTALRVYKFAVLSTAQAARWFEDAAEENLFHWIEHRKALRA